MGLLDRFQALLERYIGPIAEKLGTNNVLQALSRGMMMTLPLTVGASVFIILASFPIPAVSEFFASVGLTEHLNAIANGTMNMLGLYVAFTVAYCYADNLKSNGIVAGLISLASFFILMPQSVGEGDAATAAYPLSYLGSSGMFVSIVLGILSSLFYVKMTKSGRLTIKLPDSVPPAVSASIEPVLIGMVWFLFVMLVRVGMAATPFGNIFDCFSQLIAAPLMSIGGSIPVVIVVYMLCNMLFFCGIHPNPIQSVVSALMMTMMLTGVEQIQAGQPVEFLGSLVVFDFINNDATGSTVSLLIAILIAARSSRYRTMAKIGIVPNFFQVNEPVIFGLPVMFNTVLFIPFVLSSLVSGLMGLLGVQIGLLAGYNPAVAMAMPWTLPKFISSFFVYGVPGLVWRIVTMVLLVLLYLPFVRLMDAQELHEEQGAIETGEERA